MKETPYLTAHEAIAYLNIQSSSALYRLVREHRLPFCRLGKLYRFDRRDLDAWMHAHTNEQIRVMRRA